MLASPHDEEVGGPAEEIGAVEILDGVDNGAAPNELVEPDEEQMRFMTQIAVRTDHAIRT